MKTNLFKGFHFKTLKCPFSGVHQYFSSFFSDSALKTLDAKMLFRSVFLKTQKSYKPPKDFMPIFTKEYSYLGPLEFFENDNFAARALVGGARRKFGFGLLKSYLTFGYLTCSD